MKKIFLIFSVLCTLSAPIFCMEANEQQPAAIQNIDATIQALAEDPQQAQRRQKAAQNLKEAVSELKEHITQEESRIRTAHEEIIRLQKKLFLWRTPMITILIGTLGYSAWNIYEWWHEKIPSLHFDEQNMNYESQLDKQEKIIHSMIPKTVSPGTPLKEKNENAKIY